MTAQVVRNSAASLVAAAGEHELHVNGDLAAARSWFHRAYALAAEERDGRLMAAAALGLGGLWVHEHRPAGTAAKVESCQRTALSSVDRGSSEALRLRVRLAAEADYRAGRHDAVVPLIDQARRAHDGRALAEALSLAHHCLLGPDHAEARLRLAEELMREGSRSDRPSDGVMGLLWRTVDLFLLGDPHADRSFAELSGSPAVRRNAAAGFVVAAIRVMLAIRDGRFADAEQLAQRCAEHGELTGDVDHVGWYAAQLAVIRWYQGRITELVVPLTGLAHSPLLSAADNAFLPTLAVAAATAGDERAARSALARFRGDDFAALPRSSSWLIGLSTVVEAAALLGDADAAARAYDLLLPHARLPVMGSLAVVCTGSTHHALGVAALTTGDVDGAIVHLRTAVDRNTALGHWPATTLSRSRLGQALAVRGDLAESEVQLAVAAREAEALGMVLPERRFAGTGVLRCARSGKGWRIDLDGQVAVVDDSVGIGYLATLIANPGVEIASLDLAGGPGRPEPAHDVLDEQALRQYRRRLGELRAETDEAEASHDTERVARARVETDWLADELRTAAGLGGRTRRFAGNPERARIAVGKAIRRALDRVGEANPALGEALRTAVRTGTRCSYQPVVGRAREQRAQ